ncbi:protein PFC0760c-like [Leptidea sinapis]|uniref:protein PFC0760c-like n=1 Tax=Leptidea sinapis TaxID=189913 RepID=UPI0021C2F516|nr:protein PFC0760c-like [Leptidea sinapis]
MSWEERNCNINSTIDNSNTTCNESVKFTKPLNGCDCKNHNDETTYNVNKDLKSESKLQIQIKAKGHYKNSLRRRRSAPALYEYVTSHDLGQNNRKEVKDLVTQPHLSDPNIHALKDNRPVVNKPQEFSKSNQFGDNFKDINDKESSRNYNQKRLENPNVDTLEEIDKSTENIYTTPQTSDAHTDKLIKEDSHEVPLIGSYGKSQDSEEINPTQQRNTKKSYVDTPSKENSQASNEDTYSIEQNDNGNEYTPLSSESIPRSESSSEETPSKPYSFEDQTDTKSTKPKINNNSNESFEKETEYKDNKLRSVPFSQSSNIPYGDYQQIDTKNISENDYANDKANGDNITSIESNENFKHNNSEELIATGLSSEILSKENSDEAQELVSIKDEEVRPVIELNIEDTSEESSEKASNKLIDYKADSTTKSSSEEQDKSNLKQQFERIPLDYKHDEVEKNKTENTPEVTEVPINVNTEGVEIITKAPSTNEEFDKELNIKFGDVSIKLPDIKLPDDILAYNYEEPSYSGIPSYTYNDHDNHKPYKRKHKDDEKDNYYVYDKDIGTPKERDSYKQKGKQETEDEEDEDEDLYEKFVRERFGRTTTEHPKNSKYIVPNPELYKTIKNVLKKTEKIQEEAEKSKDPNAGYAWALEYGHNL